MAMYEMSECTTAGVSSTFWAKLGLNQGSAFNPLLFVIVMEVITKEL